MMARRSAGVRRVLGSLLTAALMLPVAFAEGCGGDDAPSGQDGLEAGGPDGSGSAADAGGERAVGPSVECAIGSAVESEPNETAATATPFDALSICGVIASAQDVDYLTFTTPPGATLTVFQAVIDGQVDFALTLNGATFGPGETSKFGPGTYLVKAFARDGKPASYRVRVQFD